MNPFDHDGIVGVRIASESDVSRVSTIMAEALIRVGSKHMARRTKRVEPLDWTDVVSPEGELLGRYAVDRGVIIVRSSKGWEKRTHSSAGGSNGGLARLILSEGPPIGWA